MAFSPKSLVRMQAAIPIGLAAGTPKSAAPNQASLFGYATDDAAATVEAAGYFNSARLTLDVGAIIFASMANSGTPVTKQYVVTACPKTTGNVTVALQATTAG